MRLSVCSGPLWVWILAGWVGISHATERYVVLVGVDHVPRMESSLVT